MNPQKLSKRAIIALVPVIMMLTIAITVVTAGQLTTNQTIALNGTLATPPPIPQGPYDFLIAVNATNDQYYAQAANGTICYTSTNCATVFTDAVASGETIAFQAGTYDLSSSLTATGINNVDLHFDKGATLFVSNGMNTPAIYLISCNSWLIQNPTINGNAVNQQDDSGSSGPYTFQYEDGIDIGVGSLNNHVDGANITNCGQMGFHVLDNKLGTSINNGITNSLITFCGWNGIGFGIDVTNSYATNVQVAYCGDVGISTYGTGSVITNNYVHDMNGTQGYNDDHGGIWVEGGGSDTITGNNIVNCLTGVSDVVSSSFSDFSNNSITQCEAGVWFNGNSNTFSGNTITQWDPADTWDAAIAVGGNNNLISENMLNSTNPYCFGISISGQLNQITGNSITCPQATILDTGTGTLISDEPMMNPANLGTGSVLGTPVTVTVNSTVTAGQVMYQGSNGKYYLAKADTTGNMGPTDVTAMAIQSSSSSCQIITSGFIQNSGWSWTIGGNIYVSASTAGGLTQTAPSGSGNVNEYVGYAVSATIIYFNPNIGSVIVHT